MGLTELEAWVGLDLVDMELDLEAMEGRLEAEPLVVQEVQEQAKVESTADWADMV